MNRLNDGRVAQTCLGATLIGHGKRHVSCDIGCPCDGQFCDELAVIDLLLAKVLIVLRRAARQLQAAELDFGARGPHRDAALIEVVACGDLPDEPRPVRAVCESIKPKGIIRRKKVAPRAPVAMCAKDGVDAAAAGAVGACGRGR